MGRTSSNAVIAAAVVVVIGGNVASSVMAAARYGLRALEWRSGGGSVAATIVNAIRHFTAKTVVAGRSVVWPANGDSYRPRYRGRPARVRREVLSAEFPTVLNGDRDIGVFPLFPAGTRSCTVSRRLVF